MMRKQWYRVVFMDGVMPVLDGYESVRRFRLWEAGHRFEEPRQHIIGTSIRGRRSITIYGHITLDSTPLYGGLTGATGEETEEEVELAVEAGMDFVIGKMAPARELLEAVQRVDLARLEPYQS